MVSRNYLPLCVKAEATSPGNALDTSATLSDDGKTLILQVVNAGKLASSARIELTGFEPRKPAAHATVLSVDWEAINTPDQPDHVEPVESEWRHDLKSGTATHTFPPYSFTVLRFK